MVDCFKVGLPRTGYDSDDVQVLILVTYVRRKVQASQRYYTARRLRSCRKISIHVEKVDIKAECETSFTLPRDEKAVGARALERLEECPSKYVVNLVECGFRALLRVLSFVVVLEDGTMPILLLLCIRLLHAVQVRLALTCAEARDSSGTLSQYDI